MMPKTPNEDYRVAIIKEYLMEKVQVNTEFFTLDITANDDGCERDCAIAVARALIVAGRHDGQCYCNQVNIHVEVDGVYAKELSEHLDSIAYSDLPED